MGANAVKPLVSLAHLLVQQGPVNLIRRYVFKENQPGVHPVAQVGELE